MRVLNEDVWKARTQGLMTQGLSTDDTRVAIEAKGISLRYPEGTEALQPCDLTIAAGALVFFTGPSGSGKTSLLQLLMGMRLPTSGVLQVLGHDMAEIQRRELRQLRQTIGPVFQDFRLVPGRTALENVVAGCRFLPDRTLDCRNAALASLERVGLAGKAQAFIEHLSWGERQRVSIARAVARQPRLILADEPTGNLDRENALHILHLLTLFCNRETTVLITTHATHLIAECNPDAVYSLSGGILDGSKEKRQGEPIR